MKVAIGCDHAGVVYKDRLMADLSQKGFEMVDKGAFDASVSVDYPDYAHQVAEAVESGAVDFGVLICGSGNGMCMAANKHQNIRAALCWSEEIAALARSHNDANILCLPARFMEFTALAGCVTTFANTGFEGGRHENRVKKIPVG